MVMAMAIFRHQRLEHLLHLFVLLVVTVVFTLTVALPGQTFTAKEKNALTKFRPMVKNLLYKDYMHNDEYLIRWLRSRNLNVDDAKEMLARNIKWRLANKIDDIGKENFEKFRKEFPFYQQGVDKDGRPVVAYFWGLLDVRKVVLAGETKGLKKYFHRYYELLEERLRASPQPNMTDIVAIFDITGFNRRQHLCLGCLNLYIYYTNLYEDYYPALVHKMYFINMPPLFEEVLAVTRPLFSPQLRKAMEFHGFDKAKWSRELLKQIPRNELFGVFGGTRRLNRTDPI